MPRPPRFNIPGLPQHVIVRGNNRDPTFAGNGDYHACLGWLKKVCLKHRCSLHAYVLMTNHVHPLVTPGSENGLGKAIQTIGRYCVQYFNHEHRRTGTLWEGRYIEIRIRRPARKRSRGDDRRSKEFRDGQRFNRN